MRVVLTWMSALVLCGCLGRAKPDLLQARLREQQQFVADLQREHQDSQSELKRARREVEQLRAELARSGKQVMAAEYSESLVRASKLQINSLLSGGLNQDEQPGDDALVAYLSLVDDDGEVVKLPGTVELTLLDPALPEPSREIGRWKFTAEECREKWTRGFAGAGYQFTVTLEEPAVHEQLVLHARLTTADSRAFDASQLVRFGSGEVQASRILTELPGPESPLDDINDPPPAPTRAPAELDAELPPPSIRPVDSAPVRDSTNWQRDEFPVRR